MLFQGRHKPDIRPVLLIESTLLPQDNPKWKKSPICSSDHQKFPSFVAKARSMPTFVTFSASSTKWHPAGDSVQVLLAAHRAVIETFISPLVVRGGLSINGDGPQQLRAALRVQGQGWMKMKSEALFLYLIVCADSCCFLLTINT